MRLTTDDMAAIDKYCVCLCMRRNGEVVKVTLGSNRIITMCTYHHNIVYCSDNFSDAVQ